MASSLGRAGSRLRFVNGGKRTLTADRVFVNVGTHVTIPAIPGLSEVRPMTHVEALGLQRRPEHLIVLGGGYVGLDVFCKLHDDCPRTSDASSMVDDHSPNNRSEPERLVPIL